MTTTRRRYCAALQALALTMVAAAAVIAGITYDAPMGGFVGDPLTITEQNDATLTDDATNNPWLVDGQYPRWTMDDFGTFPGCRADLAPSTNHWADVSVVVTETGQRVRMDTNTALNLGGRVWVIGGCR